MRLPVLSRTTGSRSGRMTDLDHDNDQSHSAAALSVGVVPAGECGCAHRCLGPCANTPFGQVCGGTCY